ncbi:synaptopodin 2-like protein isoform X2 [Denticeps clupeoides]|uniref:synaptopodin 2-like protein isoform X2 n=1 Tax=Denticeps clupeoides TaxID=299321 RepID=UPI0010A42CA4|nr:synaptopodin 2-like protein isoform X2 [Denticeps clupeoides]
MVAEEVAVTLSGGAPWGFRLQGGAEHNKPLQVSKVRKHSKACRAGLREEDELVSINETSCGDLSHGQAMDLIDLLSAGRGKLQLHIRRSERRSDVMRAAPLPVFNRSLVGDRAPAALKSGVDLGPAPLSRTTPTYSHRSLVTSPTGGGPECVTSPPDSEAYYGETDSDADVAAQERHRRQKRRSPSSSPAKTPRAPPTEEEETSEMSGYESAPDGRGYGSQVQSWHEQFPGVPRREVVYQHIQPNWDLPAENVSDNSDQSNHQDGQGATEVDSGFQEPPLTIPPPLVSHERAKEALMLSSGRQLVPMVGPVQNPLDEELTVTYMDKARQAKLHRSESIQEKQVKEARSKCRTIASLLTDSPNPNSKGVLMFKKRRQRAKKYTLTCFGSVNGETCSRGDTEDEEDESFFLGSESEMDEETIAASNGLDPTWDSGYLDILDMKSSACRMDSDRKEDPDGHMGLSRSSGKGAQLFQLQKKRSEEHLAPPAANCVPRHVVPQQRAELTVSTPGPPAVQPPTGMVNGTPSAVSSTSFFLSPTRQVAPTVTSAVPSDSPGQADTSAGNAVLNRTAKPFAPGCVTHRSATAPVVFHPNTGTRAVSVANMPAAFAASPGPAVKRAISSASLYIPARPATVSGPPSLFSPSSTSGPGPFSPQSPMSAAPFSSTAPSNPPAGQVGPLSPTYSNTPPMIYSLPPVTPTHPLPPPHVQTTPLLSPVMPYSPGTPTTVNVQPFQHVSDPSAAPPMDSPSAHRVSFNPYVTVATTVPAQAHQQNGLPSEGLASREQRIAVPASRTGILQEAWRRPSKKPMFSQAEEKTNSPNPELLSLVQNLDERRKAGPDPGFESGPEEDFLNLGAEACNFMQAQRNKKIPPPPVAPKPAHHAPQITPQFGGKGAELFARRQSRMDRYVVDKQQPSAMPKATPQPRPPSPTPSLPVQWKYSPNIRAPPPISYNPLLSPSCPPGAQRATKSVEVTKAKQHHASPHRPGTNWMNQQPYQLSPSLFSYGGGVPPVTSTNQPQPASAMPVKSVRVQEIKRFSTPTPMSTSLKPTVLVPRSATTLGEPLWRSDVMSPPPQQPVPVCAPMPPPPLHSGGLPALPRISAAPVPSAGGLAHNGPAVHFTPDRQFKSAPDLSPLAFRGSQSSGIAPPVRVPRPRFSTSTAGLQANVWRPGSILY